jgi:hypothetical protein
MKRIWILEEMTWDSPYPTFSFEDIWIHIDFATEGNGRTFKVLSVSRDSTPIMGFDEWW